MLVLGKMEAVEALVLTLVSATQNASLIDRLLAVHADRRGSTALRFRDFAHGLPS